MIIYGWKHMNKELGINLSKIYCCPHCNNSSHYKIIRHRLYFTLFFLPILPLSSKYYEICPICERGVKIKKAEAKAILAS